MHLIISIVHGLGLLIMSTLPFCSRKRKPKPPKPSNGSGSSQTSSQPVTGTVGTTVPSPLVLSAPTALDPAPAPGAPSQDPGAPAPPPSKTTSTKKPDEDYQKFVKEAAEKHQKDQMEKEFKEHFMNNKIVSKRYIPDEIPDENEEEAFERKKQQEAIEREKEGEAERLEKIKKKKNIGDLTQDFNEWKEKANVKMVEEKKSTVK